MNCSTTFRIRKAAVLAALFLAATMALHGQTYQEKLRENRERASAEYHYYEAVAEPVSPAPKGYKPFYISHYGRHGSRYLTSGSYFAKARAGLDTAAGKGLLTEEGKLVLRQLDTLMEEHEGMYGMLTRRGAEEHRGIARRMEARFPRVFSGKEGRNQVECVSSYWPRCLVSMANCTEGLQEKTEGLAFTFITGPKYLDYISMDLDTKELSKRSKAFERRIAHFLPSPDRLYAALFTDPEAARTLIGDTDAFVKSLFDAATISPNTEAHPDLFAHFTDDELAGLWIRKNNRMYYRYGISAEEGDFVRAIAKPLIHDIIEKADAALQDGSERAADLRFGHDVGLLPLVGTIGIEGMQEHFPSENVHTHWFAFDMVPMASNLQMVFFRNKRGHVLVQLLYNERETSIPALPAATGKFYDWNVLRAYLKALETAIPDDNIVRDTEKKQRSGVA